MVPSQNWCLMWEYVHQFHSDLGFSASGIMDLTLGMQDWESMWILTLLHPILNWGFSSSLVNISYSFSWDFSSPKGFVWWISGYGIGYFLVWYGWFGIVTLLLFLLKILVDLSLCWKTKG